MHTRNILQAGLSIAEASKAIIMVHGRGGDALGMLDLANELPLQDFAILAPQATNHTWYPYSFMSPVETNEPWLGSALAVIHGLIDELIQAGIPSEHIYLAGFSQGACLTLESVARKAQRYGGVIAFTGGLIGASINLSHYKGQFADTPVFITTGSPDPHVPVSRVEETEVVLRDMGAIPSIRIYPGRPHTIIRQELEEAVDLIANGF